MFLKKGEFMHPYVTVILLTVAAILLLVTWILYENRKQKKRMLRKIQRITVKYRKENMLPEILKIILITSSEKGDEFWIDDITWNDLDMDRIYMLINQTVSSPGEDVLYDMLRRPVFRQEDIDRREKLIRFFAENKEKREQMQILLSNVGKPGMVHCQIPYWLWRRRLR